jgi:hypothetical protein
MRRFVVIAALIAGCGKGGGDTVAKLTELKDAMCKCTDAACASKVDADRKQLNEEMAKTAGKDTKPDPAVVEQAEAIMIDYARCMRTATTAAAGTQAPAPAASGIQVSDVKNPEGKQLAKYAGAYDKAIAFWPKDANRLTVYVARDCPALSCSIDLSKKSAMCPKGHALVLDFTSFPSDAKPGKHAAHVAVESWGDNDSDFVGDAVAIEIHQLSATAVAGVIDRKSDRGNTTGSFQATLCK